MKKILYTDYDLIDLISQHSRPAFDYIYDQYAAVLLRVINKIVASEQLATEILKEVFVKMWNNIHEYNPEKGCLFIWLHNIARAKATAYVNGNTAYLLKNENGSLGE